MENRKLSPQVRLEEIKKEFSSKPQALADFLFTITLGEYVAATNAKIISEYFLLHEDFESFLVYDQIRLEEVEHYRLMKKASPGKGSIPPTMRHIFKGGLVRFKDDDLLHYTFEKMAIIHTVFEGASFAYMSLLARTVSSQGLTDACHTILRDETRHMSVGFKAIDLIKPKISSKVLGEVIASCHEHRAELRRLAAMTFGEKSAFNLAMCDLFDKNVSWNFRRVFG